MAESEIFSGKSGTDLTALKEALNARQQLLHKLHEELDQEREASETAASEALSMILRLQGEKAAVEMEAKQYKRMAEEKMFHADECLGIFEDVIYQKDMEIASLEFQIQAHKYKLLSLGCNDIDCVENETRQTESTFMQKIESLYGEGNSVIEDVKRNNSLPPVHSMGLTEREKARSESVAWSTNDSLEEETKNIGVDQEFKVGIADEPDIDSYWQQIKKLDERVKGLSNAKEFGRKNRHNSVGALLSHGSITALSSCLDAAKKRPEIFFASKTLEDSECSSSVQDIFEVPEVPVTTNASSIQKIKPNEDKAKGDNRLEKPDAPTVFKSLFKGGELKACSNLSPENKLFQPSGRKNLDHYNLASAHSAINQAESKLEIEQLSRRMERLEQAKNDANIRHETSAVGAEEIGSVKELLNDIRTQLGTIQSDVKSIKNRKSHKYDDSILRTLQEEMLYFWL